MQTVLIIAVTVFITCALIYKLDDEAIMDWYDVIAF